jgi:3-deoxy-manno-octulosonate cytidylyltransferase (CMP-KDO synthetase)
MIIIPARIASTRFPKKVITKIGNFPMVIKTAKSVESIDDVLIATDSKEVFETASNYGYQAVMTSPLHKSGTDRINEAASIIGISDDEIVINVQADEPFIETEVVKKVYELTKRNKNDSNILINSAYKKVLYEKGKNSNDVKVVVDKADFALYFSRSLIPFAREKTNYCNIHLGIYGFTRKKLKIFCSLGEACLEKIEKLEQLRALYHGYKIAMTEVKSNSFGIDTPFDLEKAKKIIN